MKKLRAGDCAIFGHPIIEVSFSRIFENIGIQDSFSEQNDKRYRIFGAQKKPEDHFLCRGQKKESRDLKRIENRVGRKGMDKRIPADFSKFYTDKCYKYEWEYIKKYLFDEMENSGRGRVVQDHDVFS
ncbi:hypothetical protein AA0475_1856 [Acetobacter peroxydans]|nr:hypothetical protein AA13755_0781 [Acetobacter peroxydans NBRC 13755]GBR43530.1 hypothetical protein AA0475_1856 [Acetobacter peroxydans]